MVSSHGLLPWSITAAFLATAATSMVGSSIASANTSKGSSAAEPNAYFVDALFRSDAAKQEPVSQAVRDEAGVIFAKSLVAGSITQPDHSYLDSLVSAKTGLAPGDADKRVSDVFTDARSKQQKQRARL